jgi:hypothetical protein
MVFSNTESLSDDELFLQFDCQEPNVNILQCFCDERINVMERIYSIMKIDGHYMLIPNGDTNDVYVISDLIMHLNKNCQLVALENFYQVSLTYGFCLNKLFIRPFYHCVWDNIHDVLQWWYNKFGPECAIFKSDFIKYVIEFGNLDVMKCYEDILCRSNYIMQLLMK